MLLQALDVATNELKFDDDDYHYFLTTSEPIICPSN
jgi:hypothetical protein